MLSCGTKMHLLRNKARKRAKLQHNCKAIKNWVLEALGKFHIQFSPRRLGDMYLLFFWLAGFCYSPLFIFLFKKREERERKSRGREKKMREMERIAGEEQELEEHRISFRDSEHSSFHLFSGKLMHDICIKTLKSLLF